MCKKTQADGPCSLGDLKYLCCFCDLSRTKSTVYRVSILASTQVRVGCQSGVWMAAKRCSTQSPSNYEVPVMRPTAQMGCPKDSNQWTAGIHVVNNYHLGPAWLRVPLLTASSTNLRTSTRACRAANMAAFALPIQMPMVLSPQPKPSRAGAIEVP
jgi:hypothetical protein